MKQSVTYPLRLPKSLKETVERLASLDGTSINQFVAVAVAEKVSALETESLFAEKKKIADYREFLRILRREGGEAPRPGDERE